MRRIFWLVLCMGLLLATANVTMAAGVLGVTDLMYTPTTTTLGPNHVGVAVNFGEGELSCFNLDYGLVKDLEVGLAAYHYPDDTQFSIRGKFRLIQEDASNPGLAIGVEDLGSDDISPYIVLSKNFKDVGMDGYIGFGGGSFDGIFGGINKGFYLNHSSKSINELSRIDLYLEADSNRLNIGTKLSLGPQAKINFGLVDMDSWMLGVTFLFK
jgi:hypothetical protein